jgi:hypothetical protein
VRFLQCEAKFLRSASSMHRAARIPMAQQPPHPCPQRQVLRERSEVALEEPEACQHQRGKPYCFT